MSDRPLMQRRLQILLDEPRYERLAAVARERNESVAGVIRSLIDTMDPEAERRRRAASERIRAIVDALAPVDQVPSVDEIKSMRDDATSERLQRSGLVE